MIVQQLQECGKKAFLTFEPTTSEIGLLIKRILKGEAEATGLALAYLYAADRENHVNHPETGIRAHLENGETVISDRYFFSSLAYQTMASSFDKIWSLNCGFPYPEAVIFIDTPVSECIKRIENRGEKKEIFEKQNLLSAVKENYEKAFKMMPEEVKLYRFDGTAPKEQIQNEIMDQVFGKTTSGK